MNLMVNPVITDFRQDVNGDIKMLKLGEQKEDAYANIIGQAETADLENNKAATINVSTYTVPVEVKPSTGKDGMKKATITLSNIPSPSSGEIKLALWGGTYGTNNSVWAPFIVAPSTLEEFSKYNLMSFSGSYTPATPTSSLEITEYTKISDTKFTVTYGSGSPITCELDSEHILTLKTN